MKNFTFGNWQVTAAPEHGGNLSCVKFRNRDIMRQFTEPEEWIKAPTNYGFAVLFPPNRIDEGKFVFQGKEYHLPVNETIRNNHAHGIALREKWELDKYDSSSVKMSFVYDRKHPAYAGFPFDCRLSVTYTFADSSFEQLFEVENLSGIPMPCALGFHSAFAMPQKMCIHGTGKKIELAPPRYLGYGKTVDWQGDFAPSVWCDPKEVWPFGHFAAGPKPLAEFDCGSYKVNYLPDPKFQYWMVWRKDDEFDYICAEPMNIEIGTFENTPERLAVVQPGEKECFISKIEVINE